MCDVSWLDNGMTTETNSIACECPKCGAKIVTPDDRMPKRSQTIAGWVKFQCVGCWFIVCLPERVAS